VASTGRSVDQSWPASLSDENAHVTSAAAWVSHVLVVGMFAALHVYVAPARQLASAFDSVTQTVDVPASLGVSHDELHEVALNPEQFAAA